MKAISAVIATIMLLMITVAMIGVFYAFSSTMATTTTSSGSEQAAQLTNQISSCMRIDNINGNKVDLKNCGKGVIDNKSLSVTMDDTKLGSSLQTINEDSSGTVNVTGLWQIQPGKHNLKISNGATFAQALVDVQPNKEGLAGSWSFNEGSGIYAGDGSGNGNTGTITDNEGDQWVSGKFGKGLQLDGVNDYAEIPQHSSLNTASFSVSLWFYNKSSSVQGVVGKWASPNSATSWRLYKTGNYIQFDAQGEEGNVNSETLSKNAWYFIVAAYDNSIKTSKVYTNGVLSNTNSTNVDMKNTVSGSVKIGGQNSNYFNGIIDEVRIWNKALTPDETVTMKQII